VLDEREDKSLIELKPKTGRKHQLRLHLHSLGHPILGDKKYFNKKIKVLNKNFSRHLLHAQKIEFQYLDNKKYQFESPLPQDMLLK
jgi:23S rRNA pseudouridine1911/1915/1917 synthase